MALMRWDPSRDLELMADRFERMFGMRPRGEREGEREALSLPDWMPAVDISESNEAFHIKVDLPDVKKEDVKISVEDHTLTLRGERKKVEEKKEERYHRVERSYGSFMRSFRLPENVDNEQIQAKFDAGVLEVYLPKARQEKPSGREVKID